MHHAAARYREADLLTMSPERQVVALYTHLLVQLRQAAQHGERGERAPRAERLVKAHAIVEELEASLDFEAGGEIAANLQRLYRFLLQELFGLGRAHDAARLTALIALVTDLHEAWTEAARQAPATPA